MATLATFFLMIIAVVGIDKIMSRIVDNKPPSSDSTGEDSKKNDKERSICEK